MLNYKFIDGQWHINVGDRTYAANEFVFEIFWNLSEKFGATTFNYIFGRKVAIHILTYSRYVNYSKDKAGKVVPSPDFFRSFVNIALDNVQSASYMLAYRKACETLNPCEARDAKEIDKLAMQAITDLSIHLTGKPNLFK